MADDEFRLALLRMNNLPHTLHPHRTVGLEYTHKNGEDLIRIVESKLGPHLPHR
jgi:hypothetical protein